MLSVRCLSCPVCNVCALWPNGWTDQDEKWHAGRPRPWPHCVRWGPSSPSAKGGQSPQFLAHICCSQMAAGIKMPLGTEVGLGPGDSVLDGDPAPPHQKGGSQTAGCIKMTLGMEVGLIPGDFILDGTESPLPKRGQSPSPIFIPCLLRPNG